MKYRKAITLSFDDGAEQDKRLLELLQKYQLKCTFNINSGRQKQGEFWRHSSGVIASFMDMSGLPELYQGHEIAAHGYIHGALRDMTYGETEFELEEDIRCIEAAFGTKPVGFVYACGRYDDKTLEILRRNGIHYGRTCNNTFDTSIAENKNNMLEFAPTLELPCHMLGQFKEKTDAVIDRFLEQEFEEPQILYLWGHSWAFDVYDCWDDMEALLKKISFRDDVFYGTNREVFEYFDMI